MNGNEMEAISMLSKGRRRRGRGEREGGGKAAAANVLEMQILTGKRQRFSKSIGKWKLVEGAAGERGGGKWGEKSERN